MSVLNDSIFTDIIKKAATSPRHRMNYNIHDSVQDSVQRMFHAIEPDSVFPITRHPNASETLIIVRGKLQVTIYSETKEVLEDVVIEPLSTNVGYHIPHGVWHRVKSLESGTVVFETREGPYEPVAEADIMK